MRANHSIIATLFCIFTVMPVFAQEEATGFDVMRIESEDKLVVPEDITDDVWEFLIATFIDNSEQLPLMGSGSISAWYAIEDFTDTYFDTPTLDVLHEQSGVRLRYRESRTNPEDTKSERRLMQVKINGIDDNPLNRAEYKYAILDGITNENINEFVNPVSIVDPDQQEDFLSRLAEFGWNGYTMKPVLTLHQERKRIYFFNASGALMSISHDTVLSELMGHSVEFIELEPELSEVEYTEASPELRREMETFQGEIIALIRQEFPSIKRDLTPKYNKAYDAFDEKIRLLNWKVQFGIQNFYVMIGICVALAVLVMVALLKILLARHRNTVMDTMSKKF